MAVILDSLLCVILSGVMFFCSGFATYGCYRCYTDIEQQELSGASKDKPLSELAMLKRSKERYRLRLFRRRSSSVSSDATIYSVHSSEIWSRQTTPKGSFSPSPPPLSLALINGTPRMCINASQLRGWTIKEEKEPEDENENRRNSAPI